MTAIDYNFHVDDIDFNFKIHRLDCIQNGVVIFMPSAKSEIYRSLYPYYPRHKWANSLKKYCVIYVGDPCDKLVSDFSPGSWFFHREISLIPALKNLLQNFIGSSNKNILVYGSSMGGYGALLLGQLIRAKYVIAECPQIDLYKYHPFRQLLNGYIGDGVLNSPWSNVFKFYNKFGFNDGMKVDIYINLGDQAHIRYIVEDLKDPLNRELLRNIEVGNLNIVLNNLHDGFGHVNFPIDIGVVKINALLG